jgi:hypothetical protein
MLALGIEPLTAVAALISDVGPVGFAALREFAVHHERAATRVGRSVVNV